MHVTDVKVGFSRTFRPADYEGITPSVEFTAVLGEGEDHSAAAMQLMQDAHAAVLAGARGKFGADAAESTKKAQAKRSAAKKADPKPAAADVLPPESSDDAPAEPAKKPAKESDASDVLPPESSDDAPAEPAKEPVKKADGKAIASTSDLHAFVIGLLKENKKVTTDMVQKVMSEFGVYRIRDLTTEQVPQVHAKLLALAESL